ncbi:SAF domain-containing protein [Paenibacillus sp. FSL M7-0420]|uniref:SAF domain-containing protein n=1 Tax=Paenibacillus sp. FSL M7-0420 TaxID=2921609 RepID=UPI0030F9865B
MAVRKRKKILRYTMISGSLVAVITSGVWFATYRHYNAKLIDERAAYEQQLLDKDQVLQRYMDQSQTAYVLMTPKLAGEVIAEEDVIQEKLPKFSSPDNLIGESKAIVGKYMKIDVMPGTAVTTEMVRDEARLDPSERKEETEYIKLPLRLTKKDVVDIRIVFPNGEDYIVVGKKSLKDVDLANQYTFFNDNEEEAQLLNSALVDAYINNAELYMKQYVEPELQPEPVINYVPNLDVLGVIKSNPSIIEQAKWGLAEKLRTELDKRLKAIDDGNRIRIGAQEPSGSGVSKRKSEQGAAQEQAAPVDNSQSVNGIIDQTHQAPIDSSTDQNSVGLTEDAPATENQLLEGE